MAGRRSRLIGIAVALGVAAVVTSVSLLPGGGSSTRPQPSVPSPSPTPAAVRSGSVTGAAQHFGVVVPAYQWRAFDAGSDTGLYIALRTCAPGCADGIAGITVVGRAGTIATLPCRPVVLCRDFGQSVATTLGPAADEVTLATGERTVQVLGYDGNVRRTLDLTAGLAPGERIYRLAWSPGGRLLAVLTGQPGKRGPVHRVWLMDAAGRSRLGYSLRAAAGAATDVDGIGYVAGFGGWSPDGKVLLLDVLPYPRADYGSLVVALRLQPPGAARAAVAQTLYESDRHFDSAGNLTWSPDGSLVVVRARDHLVTISPVDGGVVAQQPSVDGWLVWPTTSTPLARRAGGP